MFKVTTFFLSSFVLLASVDSFELDHKLVKSIIGSFANTCTVCKFAERVTLDDFPLADVQINLEDKCDVLPTSYSGICKRATGKVVDMGYEKVTAYFKDQNCDDYCGSNTLPITNELACQPIHYMYDNSDSLIETLKKHSTDVCKSETDVMKCIKKIDSVVDIGKGIAKRSIIRLALRIDSMTVCGINYAESEKGKLVVENARLEADGTTNQQIECILFKELIAFYRKSFGFDSNGQPNQTSIQFLLTVAKTVTAVCKKIDLCKNQPKICTDCDDFGQGMIPLLGQFLPGILAGLVDVSS
uniref:Saposin B-type domain-containing protein n=1 Tax=Rhabditophanes sp. KR3021 TaxID=114890 RepID=A0AC35U455_9BILA